MTSENEGKSEEVVKGVKLETISPLMSIVITMMIFLAFVAGYAFCMVLSG